MQISKLSEMRKPRFLTIAAVVAAFSVGMLTSSLFAVHPRIAAAQGHLAKAEEELGRAVGEFGGHRLKAMELIKSARRECEAAQLVSP
jgi:hypothetical protein